MTDAQLVRRTLDGDDLAFDQLIDRHAAACLRFATRMLDSHEDAQEVAQDAWMRAFRALDRYDASTAFRTWLFAILVNRCRTAMAVRSRRARVLVRDPVALHLAANGHDADVLPLRIELQRAIARLAPDLREAFLLKHVEQLEYTDMSPLLGASVSALKMRVQRACQQLRVELREYHHDH
jgi:RNA polymerase sigma-70 factor (ECF subfamily)